MRGVKKIGILKFGLSRLPGADWFRLLGLLYLDDLLDGVAYGIQINLTAAAETFLAD